MSHLLSSLMNRPSIKPSLLCKNVGSVYPNGLFSDYIEIITAVVVPCGGLKKSPNRDFT